MKLEDLKAQLNFDDRQHYGYSLHETPDGTILRLDYHRGHVETISMIDHEVNPHAIPHRIVFDREKENVSLFNEVVGLIHWCKFIEYSPKY